MTLKELSVSNNLDPEIVQGTMDRLIRAELVVRGGDTYVLAPTQPTSGEGAQIWAQMQASLEMLASNGDRSSSSHADAAFQEPGDTSDDDDLPESRRWVLGQMALHPGGLTLGQLQAIAKEDRDNGKDAPKRRTISNALVDLLNRRDVSKSGAIWTPAEAVGERDPDHEAVQ
jgi:hypothetical protein